MFGLKGAIIIVLAMLTAFGLFLVAAFAPFRRMTRIVTRAFWCPFRDRAVTAEFQEDAWDGRSLEVTQCSAFSPPTAITCEKRCLHVEKLRAAA